ncbi:hypothetical protein D3C84_1072570 [compost metagenome]
MLRVEVVLVEDGAREMPEAVSSLSPLIAEPAQGHQEYGIAARLCGVAATGEQQRIVTGDLLQLAQQFDRLVGQGHQMFAAALHACSRNQPHAAV